MKSSKRPEIIFFSLLYLLCLFLVFNRHSKTNFRDYHSVNWADAAGYYVYLPATFIYSWNADKFPAHIDTATGNGFFLENGKVRTKYNYGVALLQAPFFLTSHLLAPSFGEERSGYNAVYYRSVMIAGVTYLTAGLLFLFLFFRRWSGEKWKILCALFIILGATNLYYYAITSPGFSHVYSFFVFAAFIYFCGRFYESGKKKDLIMLSLLFGLAVLIRATNVLIILFFIFYNGNIKEGILNILRRPFILVLLVSCVILFYIPQFVYWKYASGKLIADMYGNETFSNLSNPQIHKLLFSPMNGWILYNPIVIVFIAVMIIYVGKKQYFSIPVLMMIACAIYLFASWFAWHFGCSYGSRPFAEYYAFLALPFTSYMNNAKKRSFTVLMSVCILFVIFNLNTIYHYDGCWYGGIWDWNEFLRIILR